jgi:hypothetical protein
MEQTNQAIEETPATAPPDPEGAVSMAPLARGVTVARLTLDQLVLVRIQAGQLPRIATPPDRDRRRSIVSDE